MMDDRRQITDDRLQTTDYRLQTKNGTRWIQFAVLCIVFLAFLLRVYRLDFFSLRGDEAFTVIFVQRTWEGLWRGIRFIEPNPPLLYLALRAWIALAGAGEFATRYFSAFFGVLCVPLLYRLAREMFVPPPFARGRVREGVWIALFAAALVAINPYQIWHSQDVRNYTMWPALSLASLIFFWKWWRQASGEWRVASGEWRAASGERRVAGGEWNLVFYVLATTASLYTHYYDTFILVAENVFVLVFALMARQWKTLGRWIGAQVVLVLAYSPWVLFGTNRITTYGEASAESGVSLVDAFSRTLATFSVSDSVPESLHVMIWIPLALALIAILIYLARENRARAAFVFLYILVPLTMLYIISLGRPLFNERYLNGIAPAYYLAFAIGLAALWPPRAAWHVPAFYLAILFFALGSAYALENYWYDPAFAKAPDWRGLSQQINTNLRDGDVIVQNFNEMSAQYYRRGNAPVITVPRDYWFRPEDEKTLQQLNKDYRRIWFIPAQPDWWDPDQDVEKFLSRYDDREQEARLSVFRLQLYETPREFESKMIAINVRIGEATLIGYRMRGDAARVPNKSTRRLALYWRAAQKTEKDLTVFVHLADANERVFAQRDNAPVRGTYPTSAWQPGELIVDGYDLDIDAPPGTYTLVAGMYDPATNVRAPAFGMDGARLTDDRVTLTQITLP